ncbi:MAG: 4a-hydroxytetrahydrobiopterin dehydratase [Candidatus Nanopelagicales bacterium]|jgi:4a-hydroxytetrahydrobiopterin dehydratase
MSRVLSDQEVADQLASLPGWAGTTEAIGCTYAFPDFPTAIAGVDEVALEAEEMNHHPDIDIRWRTITFSLSTHSAGGVTQLDIELAHRIRLVVESQGGTVA